MAAMTQNGNVYEKTYTSAGDTIAVQVTMSGTVKKKPEPQVRVYAKLGTMEYTLVGKLMFNGDMTMVFNIVDMPSGVSLKIQTDNAANIEAVGAA